MDDLDIGWLLVLLALVWLLACGTVSMLGGWYELASMYRSRQPMPGEKYYLNSASIGKAVPYPGCLFATVGKAGLALSVLLPLRFMHPPVLIPWSAIERCEKRKIWFIESVAIHIVGFDRPFFLAGALGDAVLQRVTP